MGRYVVYILCKNPPFLVLSWMLETAHIPRSSAVLWNGGCVQVETVGTVETGNWVSCSIWSLTDQIGSMLLKCQIIDLRLPCQGAIVGRVDGRRKSTPLINFFILSVCHNLTHPPKWRNLSRVSCWGSTSIMWDHSRSLIIKPGYVKHQETTPTDNDSPEFNCITGPLLQRR